MALSIVFQKINLEEREIDSDVSMHMSKKNLTSEELDTEYLDVPRL